MKVLFCTPYLESPDVVSGDIGTWAHNIMAYNQETGNSIDIVADRNIDYICSAYDAEYNRRHVCYHIVIDNELSAYPAGAETGNDGKKKSETSIKLVPSESCILETNVDAINKNGIVYTWLDEQGGYVTAKNTDKIQITAETDTVYRCLVTDAFGNQSTAAFHISCESGDPVQGPIVITDQPDDVEAVSGENVVLHIAVDGDSPSFQWQWSTDGTTWRNCETGAYNTDTFMFTMKAKLAGRQYRCVVTANGEEAVSNPAHVSLWTSPEIVKHPEDINAEEGEEVTFRVAVNKKDCPASITLLYPPS